MKIDYTIEYSRKPLHIKGFWTLTHIDNYILETDVKYQDTSKCKSSYYVLKKKEKKCVSFWT